MPQSFKEGCLSFRYPDTWLLDRQESERGWTVTLQSPCTAFLIMSLDFEFPDAMDMAETDLNAMREEYPQLESEEEFERIASQPAVGHTMSFVSLDLTNTCWTRAFDTPDGTLLIHCQANDQDLVSEEAVLKAISASVVIEEE